MNRILFEAPILLACRRHSQHRVSVIRFISGLPFRDRASDIYPMRTVRLFSLVTRDVPSIIFLTATSLSHGAVLFSQNFDSFANGADATTVPGVTTGGIVGGDSFTVSNGLFATPNNSLKLTQGAETSEPSVFFALSTPVTMSTIGFTVSYDFARSTAFDPNIWMMFGTGFGKGNVAIRNNGLNLFFDAVVDPGFQFTGDNTNIFQNLSVTYSNFTNDGSNITGWDTTLVTSGVGTTNNPSTAWKVTGQSIASISSIRLQMRGASGDVYLDNVSITAIPEPSALGLLGLSFASAMVLRRRRA